MHAFTIVALIGALAAPPSTDTAFTRRDVMIPMRDGVKLFAVVLTPKSQTGPLPILMRRTPYSAAAAANRIANGSNYAELAEDGYIFVTQDIRGRYKSEGSFVMNRPPASGTRAADESTDTWDTIEWLIRNVPNNNGRVGILGVSYPGWLTDMALINPHPALKAVSPQATMGDTWMGDDFFHQGAFRLSYGVEYVWGMEASADGTRDPEPSRYDTYSWYLAYPTLDSLARSIGARNWPTWRAFVQHPVYDAFWRTRAVATHVRHTTVPTLTVGGWWDQEDIYGFQTTYRAREATDTAHLNYFVSGPWYHGQWAGDAGDSLGNVQFGSATGVHFRRQIEVPWFAHWLKGNAAAGFAEAQVFDAGARAWKQFDTWPPRTAAKRKLYLRERGRLSFEPPASSGGSDHFVSDPAHPVPYRPRPVEWTYDPRGSRWRRWMTEDQRFVEGRPDVLVWQTAPLDRDVVIAGNITAHLFASTTGTDADWIVKLIDVYPDSIADRPQMGGYQLMVAGEILRGRYRTSFETPRALAANQPLAYTIDLHQQAYTIRKGHRIMVQVQSTWFPLYDRNPQTYVANIFRAAPSDFKAQTHTVYHTAALPSNIEIDEVRNDR